MLCSVVFYAAFTLGCMQAACRDACSLHAAFMQAACDRKQDAYARMQAAYDRKQDACSMHAAFMQAAYGRMQAAYDRMQSAYDRITVVCRKNQ